MTTKWLVQQRQAAERDLAEALALGRKDAKRRADADREREAIDRDARKVGSAIRKAERAARKMHFPLRAYPAFVEGRREGRVRMKRFEQALALALPKKVGGGHTSSFHFRMRGRGLGTWRKAKGYPYRRGEAVRTVRYIFRENAREIANGGVVSSISEDPDRIASLLAALEELELTAGRGNATVYWSLVVSLPNELTSEQRLALLDEICAPFRELGLPFGAVLHAPDPDGDQRNNHAHVVGSWRPFRTKDDGSFEFADRTLAALNTPEAIYELRERASEAMNRAMIAAGHRRRFTPKSNAARGLPPVSKAKGKSSVGQKDRERKARALEGLLRERELRQKRKRALEALAASVGQIRDIIKVPFADALLGLLATERRIAAAQVPKPLKVVVPQLGVSVSPPLPDATESPVPAAYMLQQHDQRMPVSHEKPSGIDSVVGADALESHPATPTVEAVQGVAADAAKPDGRSVEQDDSKLSDSQATRTYPTNGAMNGQQPTTNSDQKPPHIPAPPVAGNTVGHAEPSNETDGSRTASVPNSGSGMRNPKQTEPASLTRAQLALMAEKNRSRRTAVTSDVDGVGKKPTDTERLRNILTQSELGKRVSASYDGRTGLDAVSPLGDIRPGSEDGWARERQGAGEPDKVVANDAPAREEPRTPVSQPPHVIAEPDLSDCQKQRRKRRTAQYDAQQLEAPPTFADTPMPVAHAAAISTGQRPRPKGDASGSPGYDLARIYDLFHADDWDPRDYRPGSAKDRQAERSIGAANRIDDAYNDLLFAAFQARNGHSR